jgi:glycosyltransferase involved in cell wall biosynthesis
MNGKRRGVVVGFDYYAKFLADLIDEESKVWQLKAYDSTRLGTLRALLALRDADALISFGGPGPNTALAEAARRGGIPIFVIWAGSDVIKARSDPFELEVTKQEKFINLSDGPWLVDELRTLGVDAEYLPVTAVRCGGPVKGFPKRFRVLTYLPEPRRQFYGAPLVYDVARAMPDVQFTVVGAGGRSPDAPANVEFCGYVSDMQERIDSATVVLRQPEHDGKSMLVLEALARARHVVWNYEFPHVRTARSFNEALSALEELHAAHAAGQLELNHAGRAFVLDRFSRERLAARFEARLDAALRDSSAIETRPTRRVAISGLGLFCAQVAQNTLSVAPEWEPRMLRSNSRLGVLTSIYTLATCDVWYSIGSPVPDRWVHLAARLLHKPRVVHWVGSDITGLRAHPGLMPLLGAPNVTHLAEVDWTAAQLRALGFNPRIAPLPPRHRYDAPMPLPERFTILLYVPRTRSDFYGRRSFEQLMRRLRDKPIKYIIVGGGSLSAPKGVDVENLGWRNDLEDAYKRTSLLIRYTPRDGLSLMVLEALSFGRHVLWTQNFPHCRQIQSYSDMESEVTRLYEAHERGELKPNEEGSEMVRLQYGRDACTRTIAQAWHDATLASVTSRPAMQAP